MSDKAVCSSLYGFVKDLISFCIACKIAVAKHEVGIPYAVGDPSEARLGSCKKLIGEIDGASVVSEQDEESYYVVRILLNDVSDREEVAQ